MVTVFSLQFYLLYGGKVWQISKFPAFGERKFGELIDQLNDVFKTLNKVNIGKPGLGWAFNTELVHAYVVTCAHYWQARQPSDKLKAFVFFFSV